MKHRTIVPATRGQARNPLVSPSDGSSLRHALTNLLRMLTSSDELQVELPQGQAVRVRRLVHRGTQRPVLNVPSLKLARPVQCESLLEYEAALLFDVWSLVETFAEQPVRIHYVHRGEWRLHIPDFAVMTDRRKALVEVKFQKDVDQSVLDRTCHLQRSLRRVGWDYHLLTEANLRRGSVIDNARAILRRARYATCEIRALQTLERLRIRAGSTLHDFSWSTHGHPDAVSLALLITTGYAVVEWLRPLSGSSAVWTATRENGELKAGESVQWPLALFA